MKKIILGGIAAIMIAILAAVNVNMNSQSENLLSDLALANVEALAECENSVSAPNSGIITVTVCNRKTPTILGIAVGISCSEDATTTCQFTNVCI